MFILSLQYEICQTPSHHVYCEYPHPPWGLCMESSTILACYLMQFSDVFILLFVLIP